MRDLSGEHEPSLQVTFSGISDAEALRAIALIASGEMPAVSGQAQLASV